MSDLNDDFDADELMELADVERKGRREGASMNAEKGWVIDVCGTCHRLAVWPFCEHRTGRKWTVAVAVKPTAAGLSALRAGVRDEARP